ncbi:MAG TPA: hypothetical protein VFS43_15585 [Polyangiaceae bacterium]|nr:hypothetical protein [Polyangiaceae bacterium]
MPSIAFAETIRPHLLTAAERDRYRAGFSDVTRRVFDGPNAGALADAVLGGALGQTCLTLYFNDEHHLVGWNACILTEFEEDGVPHGVFRGMAALLPEYRRGQRVASDWLRCVLPYIARHPERRVFFFTPVVHVSSFRAIAKHAPVMYPNPRGEPPAEIAALMRRLADRFHCARVEGEHPLVCNRATWVREAPAAGGAPDDEITRLYRRLNPHPERGNCLLVLVPLTPLNLAGAVLKYANVRLQRWWGRAVEPRLRAPAAALERSAP